MKTRSLRRIISLAAASALVMGMCCISSSAYTYPSAYWKLHSAWDEAVAAKSPEQVISVAQQTYDLLMPLGLGEDVCYNLEPKAGRASWACEMKGDIDGAILWLERQRTFAIWLDQNIRSYKDTLLNVDARMAYLKAAQNVTIYAQSDDSASPYAVGPKTGTWYGTPADSSTTGGSRRTGPFGPGDRAAAPPAPGTGGRAGIWEYRLRPVQAGYGGRPLPGIPAQSGLSGSSRSVQRDGRPHLLWEGGPLSGAGPL